MNAGHNSELTPEEQKKAREALQAAMEKKNSAAQPDHGEPDFPDAEAA